MKEYEFEGISHYRLPLCQELAGSKFVFAMDNGKDYEVEFVNGSEVVWSNSEDGYHRDKYDCLKVEDGMYFINLEVSQARRRTGLTLALDVDNSLLTCVLAQMEGKTGHSALYTKTEIIFGAIQAEDGSVGYKRHRFTSDLVGEAIKWTYAPNFSIIHTYPTERYYRPLLVYYHDDRNEPVIKAVEEAHPVLAWPMDRESPTDWVKLRDGIYLLNIIEISHPEMLEEPKKNCLTFVFDLKRMHNFGRAFGYTEGDHAPENYVFTAFGRFMDMEPLTDEMK